MADNVLAFSIDIQGTNEQTKELGQLMSELDSVKRSMKELQKIEKLQGALTKEQSQERARLKTQLRGTQNAYNDLEATILKQNSALRKNSGFVEGVRKGVSQWATSMIGVGVAISAMSRLLGGATTTIIEFDESIANLRKVTGLTSKGARDLAKSLLTIDTRTSVTALLELASAGARLGLRGQDLIDFTKSTDTAFVSLGDSLEGTAEEIGLSLGKIAGNFGLDEKFGIGDAINKIGSSLNELGANSKATEGAIQDFTSRLSGVASQAGLTVPEVQALGALFDESGQSIEVASTTLNTLLPSMGENVAKFADVAGVNISEFSLMLKDKPFEALKLVAKGAKSSTKGLEGLSETLKNYGVDSSRAASIVGILSSKTERLSELQDIANKSFDEGISLSNEFAIKNDTLSGTLDKLGNSWEKFILSLDNGDGVLSTSIRQLTQLGIEILNLASSIDPAEEAQSKFNQTLEGSRSEAIQSIKNTQEQIAQNKQLLSTIHDRRDQMNEDQKSGKITLSQSRQISKALFDEKTNRERQIEVGEAYLKLVSENEDALLALTDAQDKKNQSENEEDLGDKIQKTKGLIAALNEQRKALIESITAAQSLGEIRALQGELEKVDLQLRYLTSKKEKDKEIELDLRLNFDNETVKEDFEELSRSVSLEAAQLGEELDKLITDPIDTRLEELLIKNKASADALAEEWSQAYATIGNTALDTTTNVIGASIDRQVDKSKQAAEIETQIQKDKLDKGIINEKDYTKEIEKINKELREKEKQAEITQAIIGGAAAVIKGIAQFGPPPSPAGIAAIASAALTTAAQIAIIDSQTFADGGVFKGNSHDQGGIKGQLNGKRIEVEGDEMWIANKKAKRSNKQHTITGTPEQIVSQVNEMYGGRGWKKGAKISDKMNVDLTKGGGTFERMITAELNDSRILRELIKSRVDNNQNSKKIAETLKMRGNGYY